MILDRKENFEVLSNAPLILWIHYKNNIFYDM